MNGFRYLKLDINKGTGRLVVAANDVASVMTALGKAQVASGVMLRVSLGLGPSSSSASRKLSSDQKQVLSVHVRSMYDAGSRVLNLAGLIAEQQLTAFVDFSSSNFVSELINAIQSHASGAITLNLGDNRIQSLHFFTRMKFALPHLANLSLQNNQIPSIVQLAYLSAYKNNLIELLLTNNIFFATFASVSSSSSVVPCVEGQVDYAAYPQFVSALFPQLQFLDGQPVQGLIEFDLPENCASAATKTLPPFKDSYFDSFDNGKMFTCFVQKYFEMYDRDQQSLDFVSVYMEHAVFSLSYTPDNRVSIGPSYSAVNRDISGLGSAQARKDNELQLLRKGPVSILSTFQQLPKRKHDINSFVVDVFRIPTNLEPQGMLNITIRGQFLETGTNNG